MKKFLALLALLLTFLPAEAKEFSVKDALKKIEAENSRYVYAARSINGSAYYVDSQSIIFSSYNNVVRVWCKVAVSNAHQKEVIESTGNKARKKMFSKVSEMKFCDEININENTSRTIYSILYSAKGDILEQFNTPWESWSPIPPESVIESILDTVKHLMNTRPELITYR